MMCSLSFHLHVSEPITHMDTDNSIIKEQVILIPLHFDVFVQLLIYVVYSFLLHQHWQNKILNILAY